MFMNECHTVTRDNARLRRLRVFDDFEFLAASRLEKFKQNLSRVMR